MSESCVPQCGSEMCMPQCSTQLHVPQCSTEMYVPQCGIIHVYIPCDALLITAYVLQCGSEQGVPQCGINPNPCDDYPHPAPLYMYTHPHIFSPPPIDQNFFHPPNGLKFFPSSYVPEIFYSQNSIGNSPMFTYNYVDKEVRKEGNG